MTPNTAASVHQRLLNRARAEGRPFNELLQRFALERFLYRLGQSAYHSRFVLKGAMMLSAWQVPSTRPTRDVDLLGRMDNTIEAVSAAIRAMCQVPVPDDGLRFDAESVVGERIVEEADYAGVRLRFAAYLGKARIPMQVDVGFGDPVVPAASAVRLAPILDFPPPEVQGYSRESVIAEKYQIMVHLGEHQQPDEGLLRHLVAGRPFCLRRPDPGTGDRGDVPLPGDPPGRGTGVRRAISLPATRRSSSSGRPLSGVSVWRSRRSRSARRCSSSPGSWAQ